VKIYNLSISFTFQNVNYNLTKQQLYHENTNLIFSQRFCIFTSSTSIDTSCRTKLH